MENSRASILGIVGVGLCVLIAIGSFATSNQVFLGITEFGLNVSSVTWIAINPMFQGFLVLLAMAGVGIQMIVGNRSILSMCNVVLLIVSLICLAVYVVGQLVPLIELTNALEGRRQ